MVHGFGFMRKGYQPEVNLGHTPIRRKITPEHASAIANIDFSAVKNDIEALLTDSKDFWPADYGTYGPLFIRLAWHASGSYRTSDGRGGADGGRQRFDPERSWADNTNLDKARSLLEDIKIKYGQGLSWGDLIVLAGDTAIESMGGPNLGFCGGRIDDHSGDESALLGPSDEQEALYPCKNDAGENSENGTCKAPLGSTTVGLIYVNPEGPLGDPKPKDSVHQVRDTFGRMNMNDSETIALIGGGHAVGKTHGACPDGPGDSPKDNPEHPWEGLCGTGEMKGKGPNTFTSGFEFPWTTTPTKWSNQFFQNLLNFNWILEDNTKTPGGHYQWKVNGTGPTAPAAHGDGEQPIGMLTTDRSLLNDSEYRVLLQKYADSEEEFNHAFKNAWYKLTSRDMGPYSRCIGDNIPPPQEWQYPLPEFQGELPDINAVKSDIRELMNSVDNMGSYARLAWQCMSTFRSTDYLGGCNGARIRFPTQQEWSINTGIQDIIETLRPIKDKYEESLSWADLIVLAGNTEIEKMGGNTMTFCGGRTDASSDAGASDYLEPKINGSASEDNLSFKEYMGLMGLTPREYAALHGAGYALGQNKAKCAGLFCQRDTTQIDKLSNIFFKRIVNHRWHRDDSNDVCYKPECDEDLCMYPVDVQFSFDAELKTIAEDYAFDNYLFLEELASAWTKLANADRFDGPTGNICDNTPPPNSGRSLKFSLGLLFFTFTFLLINNSDI